MKNTNFYQRKTHNVKRNSLKCDSLNTQMTKFTYYISDLLYVHTISYSVKETQDDMGALKHEVYENKLSK